MAPPPDPTPKNPGESKDPTINELYYGGAPHRAADWARRDALLADQKSRARAYQPIDALNASAQARNFDSVGARNTQRAALSRLADAADGKMPSAAELQSRRATADAIRGGYGLASAVKGGPGARVAAMRQARMGAALQASQGANQAAQIRAQEMAQARGALAAQSNALRGADQETRKGDLMTGDIMSRNESQQRALNLSGEQFYEGLAHNVRSEEFQGALQKQGLSQGLYLGNQGMMIQRDAQGITPKDVLATGGSVATGVGEYYLKSRSPSDERTKAPASLDAYDWNAPSMSDAIADKQREGIRDTRSFKRDTPADQKRVAENYYGGLAKEADALKAGMAKSLARGASVVRDEGDVDDVPTPGPAPWLVAEMEGPGARNTTISDADAKVEYYVRGLKHGGAQFDEDFVRSTMLEGEKKANPKQQKAVHDGAVERNKQARDLAAAKDRALALEMQHGPALDAARQRGAAAAPRQVPSAAVPSPVVQGPPAQVPAVQSQVMKPGYEHGQTFYSDERAKTGSRGFPAPSEEDLAEANRSMSPSVYAYKPGFDEMTGQRPGEPNVGPMAQNMARSDVARTAVTKDPRSGMLMIDEDKGLKLVMGGLASVQKQLDEMKGARR